METMGTLILGLVIGWLAHKLLFADRAGSPALAEPVAPPSATPGIHHERAPERDPNVRPLSETAAVFTGKAAAVAGVAAEKLGSGAHRAADAVSVGAQRAAEALQTAAGRLGAAAPAAEPPPSPEVKSESATGDASAHVSHPAQPLPVADLDEARHIIDGQQAEIRRLQAQLDALARETEHKGV